MVAVGIVLLWGGYTTALWAWCLFSGYNVTLGQLANPVHPYHGKWPPPYLSDDKLWPSGKAADQQAGPPGSGGGGGTSQQSPAAGAGTPGAAGRPGGVASRLV